MKEFLYSIFVVPLTAGNGVRTHDGPRIHDGTISTLALGVFLIGIAFVTIFVTSSPETSDPDNGIRFIMIFIVLFGVAALSILWFIFRRQMRENDLAVNYRTDTQHTGLRLKFLWLFCLGLIVRSVLSIFIGSQRLHESYHTSRSAVRILWNTVLFVFACIQTAFITYFRNIEIVGSLKIHYAMIFIVVSNLSIWFDSILLQERNVLELKNDSNKLNNRTGIETFNCANISAIVCFSENAFPYVLPIVAEFCLVSVGFLLGIWSTAKKKLIEELLMKSSENLNESHSLIQNSGEYLDIDRPSFQYGQNRKSSLMYLSAGIGVVFVVILVIFVLILMTQKKERENLYETLEIYRLFYTLLMLFLVFLSYRLLWLQCTPINHTNPISSSEYILLFSCLGIVVYLLLGIHAAVTVPKKNSWNVVENIMSLILIYFQTVLIMQANRYRRYRKLLFLSIKNVFTLLFVLNLGLWLNDSFLENKVPYINQVNYFMYGQRLWDFANGTLFPIIVVYRFQSSMMLYELYHLYKSHN